MTEFRIGLAGRVIGITCMYDYVYELCEDYLVEADSESCENTEDFHVTVTQADIDFERDMAVREDNIPENYQYPDPYLESLSVYRKIATEILAFDTWLMHGAVVGVNDEAVIFAAPSGVGKTTHLKLWLENIPGTYVVNGDKPFLQWQGDVCRVCGTPWAGKEGLQTNKIIPLRAVCFLERSAENKIERISEAEAYPLLLQQSYRSMDVNGMIKTLELIRRVCMTLPMYRISCTMDAEAAKVAYEGIYGRKH